MRVHQIMSPIDARAFEHLAGEYNFRMLNSLGIEATDVENRNDPSPRFCAAVIWFLTLFDLLLRYDSLVSSPMR
jgi:hypothetical protein